MKDLMHTIIRSELHFKGNIEIKCHCSTFMPLTYCEALGCVGLVKY